MAIVHVLRSQDLVSHLENVQLFTTPLCKVKKYMAYVPDILTTHKYCRNPILELFYCRNTLHRIHPTPVPVAVAGDVVVYLSQEVGAGQIFMMFIITTAPLLVLLFR
jgi:hypothetical protein